MKKFTFILFFLFLGNAFAQKIIEREFNASEITSIEINSDVIYHIKITSEKTKQIKIKTYIEGENYENVVLGIVEENNNILYINTSFTPFFKAKNDKLAVHKVISIEMELIVPESKVIKIEASIASVEITGKYKAVSVLLESGNCSLFKFKGNAKLKTKQGFIKVYASRDTFGLANSIKGVATNNLDSQRFKNGYYRIVAESVSGDISLYHVFK
ncbi:MAG: hypothetical protein L3J09_05250 [Flavobacteriaceae bacterium]|nr:hypothetical protein [Flavobacteriaceae bacterium]